MIPTLRRRWNIFTRSIPDTPIDGSWLCLARISHNLPGLRGAGPPTGQESRAARCRASSKRLDAPCRWDSTALRVASRRPAAASRASTVASATLLGPLLAGRPPGRDADRGGYEKCGLDACIGTFNSPDGAFAQQAGRRDCYSVRRSARSEDHSTAAPIICSD